MDEQMHLNEFKVMGGLYSCFYFRHFIYTYNVCVTFKGIMFISTSFIVTFYSYAESSCVFQCLPGTSS
jgi:hypothetical protein